MLDVCLSAQIEQIVFVAAMDADLALEFRRKSFSLAFQNQFPAQPTSMR